jgi:hypothetical protein
MLYFYQDGRVPGGDETLVFVIIALRCPLSSPHR